MKTGNCSSVHIEEKNKLADDNSLCIFEVPTLLSGFESESLRSESVAFNN